MKMFVGCAGWSLRKEFAEFFPGSGTHLQRYAGRFSGVEINSSFYRPHRQSTYRRWAESTPPGFRFAVKLPRQITHTQRLRDAEPLIEAFAAETSGLGEKFAVVLVQLPPSLVFQGDVAAAFLQTLHARLAIPIVLEPRHGSWFGADAERMLLDSGVGRVAADPSIVSAAAAPAGDLQQVIYFRWHGSPKMYYSAYDEQTLRHLASRVNKLASGGAGQIWCIFDNTAEGAATTDAIRLSELLTTLAPSSNFPPQPDTAT